MWRIWWAPNNARKWQMEFNSPFKGLRKNPVLICTLSQGNPSSRHNQKRLWYIWTISSLYDGQSLANTVCGLYLLVISLLFILSSHLILDFVRNIFSSDFPIIFVYIWSLPLFYGSASFFLSDLIALIIFLKCTNWKAPQCVIFSIFLSLPITSIPQAPYSKTHLVLFLYSEGSSFAVFLTKTYWPLAKYSSIFRYLLQVCPSVYMHVSAQLQLKEIPWNLWLVTFMKFRRETPNLEIPDTLHEYLSTFSFTWRRKFAIHHFCATIIFLLSTVMWSSTTHREDIVAFPLLQWSRAIATTLHNTYITYRLYDTMSVVNTQYTSNKCPALTQALLAGTLYHRPSQTAATAQHEARHVLLNISLAKPRSNSEAILKPSQLCIYCYILVKCHITSKFYFTR
jgi:hypothetical protein